MTGAPRGNDLVRFPGEYKPDTPGLVYNVYNTPVSQEYVVPGPRVAELEDGPVIKSEKKGKGGDGCKGRKAGRHLHPRNCEGG